MSITKNPLFSRINQDEGDNYKLILDACGVCFETRNIIPISKRNRTHHVLETIRITRTAISP